MLGFRSNGSFFGQTRRLHCLRLLASGTQSDKSNNMIDVPRLRVCQFYQRLNVTQEQETELLLSMKSEGYSNGGVQISICLRQGAFIG